MTIIATRYLNDSQTDIPVVAGPATIALNAYGFGQLPGVINYGGTYYDCTQPGLISFFDTNSGVAARRPMWTGIGKTGQDWINAVYGWISACSWMHVHGTADEGLTQATLAGWMKQHKARLRCGAIVDFMVYILPQLGVYARRVGVLTGKAPNGYDDGHICFEAYLGGRWRFWDLTNGAYYADANGDHLNLKEIIAKGINNCVRVRVDADRDFSCDPAGSICFGVYFETMRKTPQGMTDWYDRIFAIPYVGSTAFIPAQYAGSAGWVNSLGIGVVTEASWNATFYP
ncbi:MAG TPA: hypothetical protein VK663_01100 [Burkholderiales bacterium]|nr:hypothetical protein [Burkholderiales bacterium]